MWNRFGLNAFFVCATALILSSTSKASVPEERRCSKVYKLNRMFQIACRADDIFDVKKVDGEIPSDIESIDLSHNYIKELGNYSFSKYTHLKILYLHLNIIISIEPLAFEGLTSLQVLDLSHIGADTIPENLLNLSSLTSLSLSGTKLHQSAAVMGSSIKANQSYGAPIEKLFLSDCKQIKIPEFVKHLPSLKHVDLSQNDLRNVEDLAHLCQLEFVNLTNSLVNTDQCEFKQISAWLKKHNVQVVENAQWTSNIQCEQNVKLNKQFDAARESCIVLVQSIKTKQTLTTVAIVVSCIILLVLLIISYIVYRRKKSKKGKKMSDSKPSPDTDPSELLQRNNC